MRTHLLLQQQLQAAQAETVDVVQANAFLQHMLVESQQHNAALQQTLQDCQGQCLALASFASQSQAQCEDLAQRLGSEQNFLKALVEVADEHSLEIRAMKSEKRVLQEQVS